MYARFFRWASDRLSDNGVLAFVTNRSFIESRTFDGFRKTVAQEFSDIYVVDLGGDVRANPKLSGTKNNVFGIQTGVAISFFIKKNKKSVRPELVEGSRSKSIHASTGSARTGGARIYYNRRPELETAEEKLSFLANHPMRHLVFDHVQPDKSHNWVNLTDNDFDTLLPLASKDTKAAKTTGKERAIFKLYSLGISTNRDDWVTDFSSENLRKKMQFFISKYEKENASQPKFLDAIKWSRNLKRRFQQGKRESFSGSFIRPCLYRPFTSVAIYDSPLFVDELGLSRTFFPSNQENKAICVSFSKDFLVSISNVPYDIHFVGDAQGLAMYRYDEEGNRADNITDWALKQFQQHYKTPSPQPSPASGRGRSAAEGEGRSITKQAIFHYCYAVLHDPLYREKYALNLKREFPRIPFYADFWQWAAWGEALMALHIGYESVAPYPLKRIDIEDVKARAAGFSPKAILRADKEAGSITLDSETILRGIPPAAWHYKLGNRCALEWILDQYKEKKPKDPTIREKFDTYRFADYKEKVVDLLLRVTTVSVETERITEAMKAAAR